MLWFSVKVTTAQLQCTSQVTDFEITEHKLPKHHFQNCYINTSYKLTLCSSHKCIGENRSNRDDSKFICLETKIIGIT